MLYDIIIIGGGPAGISAGIYAARKKVKTLLITKDFLGSTFLASQVENYLGFTKISGAELMKKFTDQLKEYQIEIRSGEEIEKIVINSDLSFNLHSCSLSSCQDITKNNLYRAKTIIIATGVKRRSLNIPGEKEFIGKGVSYCSVCDAYFFQNKIVAVVGGGNAAFNTALDLANFARQVYLIIRSSFISADELYQEKIKDQKDRITIIKEAEVKLIKGQETVQSLIYFDRRNKIEKEIQCQGIFVEIGGTPNVPYLMEKLILNEKQEIIVDKNCATKVQGLFAAGDVTDTCCKQIITAAADGAKAALSAYHYLSDLKNDK